MISLAVLVLATGFLSSYASEVCSDLVFKGMNYPVWSVEGYASPASEASLSLLMETGANWVGIIVTEYMDTRSSTEISPDHLLTPSETSLFHIVQLAHAYGFKVLLKLHVDLKDGTWRGQISPLDVRAWFESYKTRALHYAELAEKYGVDLFCLGTEFRSLSGKHFRPYWEDLIGSVREIYTGPLTYAANWDEFQTVSFWDLLDYIGIDAYFPLSGAQTPSVEELLRGWKLWVSLLEDWQKDLKKPVIFTEIGYRSVDYSAQKPWDWTSVAPYNAQAQANCYEAVFRAFADKDWFLGLFFWHWEADPMAGGPGDLGYTPQNKPAQEVLITFFKSPSLTGHNSSSFDHKVLVRWAISGGFDPAKKKEVVYWEKIHGERAAGLGFLDKKEVCVCAAGGSF